MASELLGGLKAAVIAVRTRTPAHPAIQSTTIHFL